MHGKGVQVKAGEPFFCGLECMYQHYESMDPDSGVDDAYKAQWAEQKKQQEGGSSAAASSSSSQQQPDESSQQQPGDLVGYARLDALQRAAQECISQLLKWEKHAPGLGAHLRAAQSSLHAPWGTPRVLTTKLNCAQRIPVYQKFKCQPIVDEILKAKQLKQLGTDDVQRMQRITEAYNARCAEIVNMKDEAVLANPGMRE